MFGSLLDIVTAPIKIAANVSKAVVKPIVEEIVKPIVEEVADVANEIVEDSKDIF